MTFTKEHMQTKTNQFWDAYFKVLKNRNKNSTTMDPTLWDYIDIDEDYCFSHNHHVIILARKNPDYCVMGITCEPDICTAALKLLPVYLDRVV